MLGLLALSACLSGPSLELQRMNGHLVLPSVDRIMVSGHDGLPIKTISEPRTIGQIIDELNRLNVPMSVSRVSEQPLPKEHYLTIEPQHDPHPSQPNLLPHLTVVFNVTYGQNMKMFVGLGWIGGGDGIKMPMRFIQAADQAQLQALLGVPEYKF